jgi:peptidoglycan hydrolase-like protein with peptidoglycan-binding domain
MKKKPSLPPPPYAETKLPGGPQKIIQICEDLRTRNEDGYLPHVGGLLARIKGGPGLPTPPACKGTTCSPFTATVIALAFDPKYPRDDLKDDPYVPMFNGGADPLTPFQPFYSKHNKNDSAVASVVEYGLGKKIEATELRRGDLVEISWENGGGHSVFCWDVHLDADGKVDAIQFLGSNNGVGVSISGCKGERWLTGKNAVLKDEVTEVTENGKKLKKHKYSVESRGTLEKAKDKIFVDEEEIVTGGTWYALPGIKKDAIDLTTFRGSKKPRIVYPGKGYTFAKLRCARFHYDGDPPAPYCMTSGTPQKKTGHTEAPAVVVKEEDRRRVAPRRALQEKDRTVDWQHQVERALQTFYRAGWIDTDPGEPDKVNDARTQAALRKLQETLGIEVDGKIGPQTLSAIERELPACNAQKVTQERLRLLSADAGAADGVNHAKMRAAIEKLQKAQGLRVSGVPDSATTRKIAELAPPVPQVRHLYWVGNTVEVGGKARLRLHSKDLRMSEVCEIHLNDERASVVMAVDREESEVRVPIPFPAGTAVRARVVTKSAGEVVTSAPLLVASGTETASWRPYIDKDTVPDEILEAVRRNRARYPMKTFPDAKGKWAGPLHYDYKPPKAHAAWAREYFARKVDDSGDLAKKHVGQAFLLMLRNEGLPASFQTYDNQIITWGVGLGAKGDGVHAFEHLNANAAMKKLLDDIGINYFDGRYHVVDLTAKKVVSSTVTVVKKKRRKSVDHVPPLEAVRQQKDLMSALIGMSEDSSTREAVAESQWEVYLSNSTRWPGQDKIASLALYFMITHMMHWLPAIGKGGVKVEEELAALGDPKPSFDTDTKLAPRFARRFVAVAEAAWKEKRPNLFADVKTRTKTRLWKQFRDDAIKEGFDPGELTYE